MISNPILLIAPNDRLPPTEAGWEVPWTPLKRMPIITLNNKRLSIRIIILMDNWVTMNIILIFEYFGLLVV